MTTTDDPEKFEERWNEHIDQLERLKSSLPMDRWNELEEIEEELKALVEDAAVTVEGDDE